MKGRKTSEWEERGLINEREEGAYQCRHRPSRLVNKYEYKTKHYEYSRGRAEGAGVQ